MTPSTPASWRADPYRRHELRFWDGGAWTSRVRDLGLTTDDPVFPVPPADGGDYLTARRRHHRGRPLRLPAAVCASVGTAAVVALAVLAAIVGGPGHREGPLTPVVHPVTGNAAGR